MRRARYVVWGEVVSGLQYCDEQDHGSRAQPDIVEGLFLPRMQNVCCLQARGKSKGPLIAPLGRTKGDCPRDFELNAVVMDTYYFPYFSVFIRNYLVKI